MFEFLTRMFSPSAKKAAPPAVEPSPAPIIPAPLPAPVVAPIPVPAPVPRNGSDAIALAYADIVPRFPSSLAPFVSAPVTGAFELPVKTALEQLPTGAVRIRFAELRLAAPAGTFAEDDSLDETLVDLPLPKILEAMNPALLKRRNGQTDLIVPESVPGLFTSKNPAVAPKISPVVSVPTPPKPSPAPPATIPFSPPPPATIPMPQGLSADKLTLRISAVYEFWPDVVRHEITQGNLRDETVSLPISRVESALKTGRVIFNWGEMTSWLDVPAPQPPTTHPEALVELPLKVVAPLFMAHRRPAPAQKTINIGEHVPALFLSPDRAMSAPIPPPVSAPPPPPPVPAPKPLAPPPPAVVAAPVVVAKAPVAAATLGGIFGEPSKTDWSPQEITQMIGALPGVAGSLIAASDGFLVAGTLPPPLKSETLAAFLPQIFGRLAHYSSEVQLGAMNAVTLQAGPSQCTIYKTGALYLAVLAKPGEKLPDVLQAVAAELGKVNP
jgi:predicted regulator of Ras-like GTPase activity (Roadblock/LC7/MglB family)